MYSNWCDQSHVEEDTGERETSCIRGIEDFTDKELADELFDFPYGELGFSDFDKLVNEVEARLLEIEAGKSEETSGTELIARLRNNKAATWKFGIFRELAERLIAANRNN